jgi:hypothetical protein
MTSKFQNADFAKHYADGNADYVLYNRSVQQQGIVKVPIIFYRYVVIDVISDNQLLNNSSEQELLEKIKYWNSIGVTNLDYAKALPRNTIVGQRLNDSSSSEYEQPMFLFPFFPSHLALPCKPGEHVWVMFESENNMNLGYWFCKITDVSHVDDVNHSHAPRSGDTSFFPGTKDLRLGNVTPNYTFRPGKTGEKDGEEYTVAETSYVDTTDERFYEKLLSDSDASKIMVYEAIPRFRKRPGDIAIEGSNNTLIVLGTDRTGPYANNVKSIDSKGKIPNKIPADMETNAGAIDMVAGRGQTNATAGTEVISKTLDGHPFHKEIGKSNSELNPNEGDPDWINDKSRILISQRTKIDTNLKIQDINQVFEIQDQETGDAAILLKSDKIRVIGRKDAQILVKDDNGQDVTTIVAKSTGDLTIKVKNTTIKIDNTGNIIMDAEGDVTVNPNGVIKLGSVSASRPCARQNDKTTIDFSTDPNFMNWLLQLKLIIDSKAPLPFTPPLPLPIAPTEIMGKITTGSGKVLIR